MLAFQEKVVCDLLHFLAEGVGLQVSSTSLSEECIHHHLEFIIYINELPAN